MDIELLRTFLEVARTRHFGKAAIELCVTQSAVSARVRQLEETIGMPLFTRSRNNIQLTPEGRQLLKHAETIVQVWARARQETGLGAEFTRGLAIGAMLDLWQTLLGDWLEQLRTRMPETALQVETGTADLLIRKLLDSVIDLAVLFEPPQAPELEIRELGVINLVLAATRRGLKADEACRSGYILVDWGTAFARNHARLFPDLPAPALHMNLGTLARRHLDHSEGAAYLPEQMLSTAHGSRRLYRVKSAPQIERPVFAVYHTGSDRKETIREALELLS
ncbi:MAG TPA: LysR family transcriptional regulator [Gammaproteobacteria bacterium]|nr:LysR family transcriptional regulator [Gammaproteobacteria bacterium]